MGAKERERQGEERKERRGCGRGGGGRGRRIRQGRYTQQVTVVSYLSACPGRSGFCISHFRTAPALHSHSASQDATGLGLRAPEGYIRRTSTSGKARVALPHAPRAPLPPHLLWTAPPTRGRPAPPPPPAARPTGTPPSAARAPSWGCCGSAWGCTTVRAGRLRFCQTGQASCRIPAQPPPMCRQAGNTPHIARPCCPSSTHTQCFVSASHFFSHFPVHPNLPHPPTRSFQSQDPPHLLHHPHAQLTC